MGEPQYGNVSELVNNVHSLWSPTSQAVRRDSVICSSRIQTEVISNYNEVLVPSEHNSEYGISSNESKILERPHLLSESKSVNLSLSTELAAMKANYWKELIYSLNPNQ